MKSYQYEWIQMTWLENKAPVAKSVACDNFDRPFCTAQTMLKISENLKIILCFCPILNNIEIDKHRSFKNKDYEKNSSKKYR